MRTLKLLSVALLAVSLGRGVRLPPPAPVERPTEFDRAQSAALFVGVREFPHDPTLPQVQFAADDAVDLAWVFALEPRVSLVMPHRVVIALSGAPQKEKSRERLAQLVAAGARIEAAIDVAKLLEQQATAVGSGGVLIAAVASHGFSSEGATYVLAASSVFDERETSVATAKLLEIAGTAPRSIVILDACRERQGTRAPVAMTPVLEGITESAGQAVISISGRYAYDDFHARNGALTAAIIDGLLCKASTDVRGVVTVETLWMYVEQRLLKWVRKNREPNAVTATEVKMSGQTKTMPLAACSTVPVPITNPARVETEGMTLTAFGDQGAKLWPRTMEGPITSADVADLDGDGYNEVIAAVGGKILAFSPTGQALWTADTNAPLNYDVGAAMRVTRFVTGDLFRKKRRQIVALSVDESGAPASRLSVIDPDGRIRGGYFHPGRLLDVAIAAETARRAPKIIVTGVNHVLHESLNLRGQLGSVFMFDPKKVGGEAPPYRGKLGFGTQIWYGFVRAQTIERLEIVDHNNDGQRDISLETPNGSVHLDFRGRIIESDAQFGVVQ
jgi:hypothetical protein